MAESIPSKDKKVLILNDSYNALDIESFSRMMKDPSYCYKFYWLEAIVKLISRNVEETTFDEIINEMICNAWYSVREYHIHLSGINSDGEVRDGLERVICRLADITELTSNASDIEIRNAIKANDSNRDINAAKLQLTNMVPYRALASFFNRYDDFVGWDSNARLVSYMRKINGNNTILPYVFGEETGLKRKVYFQKPWIDMIKNETSVILGWIQYEKVKWLQNNNPEVPGLVYKLSPSEEKKRKLESVHVLWDAIIELTSINDVFTEKTIKPNKYDVDHFIPWSFVMNDELWNLMPMDSSLNSSKNNKLPRWEPYFKRFAANQFVMANLIHDNDNIHKLYDKCYKYNLHSVWAITDLYRGKKQQEQFYKVLEENMRPVYESARRQGYEVWIR